MVDVNETTVANSSISNKRKYLAEKPEGKKDGKGSTTDALLDTASNISSSTIEKKKKRKNKHGSRAKKHVAMDKKEKSAARLPQSATDWSSNWKSLLQQMEEENKNSSLTKMKSNYSKNNYFKKSCESDTKRQNDSEVSSKIGNAKSPEVWFDGVDECLIEQSAIDISSKKAENHKGTQKPVKEDPLIKDKSFSGFTKAIAMDCEMVGVGFKGSDSVLARVSIVNHFGHCVYDKYVKAREKVTDYRTAVSGIRASDIENANDFKLVQKEVSDILNKRILVGHAIRHDLKVLFLDHPKRMIRDTSTYKPFRALFGGRTPSLKNLSARMLGVSVQQGEHSSVQDAQAAMRLYTMFRKDWEKDSNMRSIKNVVRSEIKSSSQVSNNQGDIAKSKETEKNICKMPPLSSDLKRKNQLKYVDSD